MHIQVFKNQQSKLLGYHNLFLGPDCKACLFLGCLLNGAAVLERKYGINILCGQY